MTSIIVILWLRTFLAWTVLAEQTNNCTEISGLNISTLTKENFDHKRTWSTITCIILQRNVIRSIEQGLFSNFKNLKWLFMKNIEMLGKGIVDGFEGINSTDLVQLGLENVGLTSAITEEIFTKLPRRIKVLNLQHNHIERFSFHSIRHLKTIGTINLSGNKDLDFSIGTLQNFTFLKNLYLSSTNFHMNSTFCPKGWSHFPNLKTLYMNGNTFDLSAIDIKNCFKKVRHLDLSYCQLLNGLHDRSFSNFPNMVFLKLTGIHNTKVFHLPTFEKNKYLQYLDLSTVNFSFPPSDENMGGFQHLEKLLTLRMNDWNLSQWDSLSLSTLYSPLSKSIQTLQLINVGLSEIPMIVWKMSNLTTLSMGHNYISRLERPINTTSIGLKTLHLQSNQIAIVYPESIPKSVTDLNLSGNPFDCRCPLMRYVNWVREHDTKNARDWPDHYFCAKPQIWKSRSLWEFAHRIKPTDCRPFNAYVIASFVICFILILLVIVTNVVTWRRSKVKSVKQEPLLPKT